MKSLGCSLVAAIAIGAGGALSGAGCAPLLRDVTPTEPLRTTVQITSPVGTGDLDIAIEKLLLGDDIVADGLDDEALLGVALKIVNHGPAPYQLDIGKVSMWLALDARHPEATLSFSPLAGGPGAPPGELTVSPTFPIIVVPPGDAATAWVYFFSYQFPNSDVPRHVTLNLPGPEGRPIRVTLADPARGQLRWKVPARRSQLMIGFQNMQLFGGTFRGIVPTTVFSRVARVGSWLWDVGFMSGVAAMQEGRLMSSTSAFSILGLSAHLSAPLLTRGSWKNPGRLGLFAGGTAAAWLAIGTPAEMSAGVAPKTYGVLSVEGGLEVDVGPTTAAATPFPLTAETRVGLPRWSFRLGYTQAWTDGGTSAGFLSAFRLAF